LLKSRASVFVSLAAVEMLLVVDTEVVVESLAFLAIVVVVVRTVDTSAVVAGQVAMVRMEADTET
jgi:hypothetical protein